jgi:hypothetical protein
VADVRRGSGRISPRSDDTRSGFRISGLAKPVRIGRVQLVLRTAANLGHRHARVRAIHT